MATKTVVSGGVRRRWTSSEKAAIVEESLQPGAFVTDVARRHAVCTNQLHRWRREAQEASVIGVVSKLLPVTVTGPGERAAWGSIEIEIGSVRVRVDASVDEAALGRVLRALGR